MLSAKTILPKPCLCLRDSSQQSVLAGTTAVRLDIYGDYLVEGASVVRVNGVRQQTNFVRVQQLAVAIPDELVVEPASLEITVFTAPPGGGESKPPAIFVITPAQE